MERLPEHPVILHIERDGYPETRRICFQCEYCGEDIYENEDYFEIDGVMLLCKDCMEACRHIAE